MKTTYNKRSDVLYLILSETPNHCSYTESPDGVIARIDDVTHEVVGITIYDFLYKTGAGMHLTGPPMVDPQFLDDALQAASVLAYS